MEALQSLVGLKVAEKGVTLNFDSWLITRFAGARILLTEDEPINQEFSRGLLEDVGQQMDLAADGVEALALARQTPNALILMDVRCRT